VKAREGGVAGAFETLPRKRKGPRTGADITVSIGKPVPSTQYQDWPRDKVLEDLFRRIQETRQRAESLRRKS
jgi:hypothetical protein